MNIGMSIISTILKTALRTAVINLSFLISCLLVIIAPEELRVFYKKEWFKRLSKVLNNKIVIMNVIVIISIVVIVMLENTLCLSLSPILLVFIITFEIMRIMSDKRIKFSLSKKSVVEKGLNRKDTKRVLRICTRDYLKTTSIVVVIIVIIVIISTLLNRFDFITTSRVIVSGGVRNISLRTGLIPVNDSVTNLQANTNTQTNSTIRQYIDWLLTKPNAKITNDGVVFVWENKGYKSGGSVSVKEQELSFELRARVITKKVYPRVDESIKLSSISKFLNKTLRQYLERTERFDYNELIRKRTSEIIEGSPDEFTAVSKIGFWLYKNMNYDLKMSGEEKSASWVFENMRGTCDEYSALMIAMLRSIGIPSREVEGFSYSNMEEIKGFNAHSWVEVYFPNNGWLEFDPTYGEFGSVDVTHIRVLNASVNYEWVGDDTAVLTPKKTITRTEVIDYSGKVKDIGINVSVMNNKVDIDSYNVVYAIIENKLNSYNAKCFRISENPNLIILSDREKCFVMKPKTNYTIAWVVRTKDLSSKYLYTIPISIYNREVRARTEFKSSIFFNAIKEEEAKKFAEEIESKDYELKSDVSVKCLPSEVLYEDGKTLSCYFKNTGTTNLNDLRVCFNDGLRTECRIMNLLINELKKINFTITLNLSNYVNNTKRFYITINYGANQHTNQYDKKTENKRTIFLERKILKKPYYELETDYNESKRNITLYIKIRGYNGKNEKLRIKGSSFNKIIQLNLENKGDNEIKTKEITIDINKDLLRKGNNTISIDLLFNDEHYRKYEVHKDITLFVKDKDVVGTIKYYLNMLLNWLENLLG